MSGRNALTRLTRISEGHTKYTERKGRNGKMAQYDFRRNILASKYHTVLRRERVTTVTHINRKGKLRIS